MEIQWNCGNNHFPWSRFRKHPLETQHLHIDDHQLSRKWLTVSNGSLGHFTVSQQGKSPDNWNNLEKIIPFHGKKEQRLLFGGPLLLGVPNIHVQLCNWCPFGSPSSPQAPILQLFFPKAAKRAGQIAAKVCKEANRLVETRGMRERLPGFLV